MTKLYLAIPCYNEEEVLRDSAEKLLNKYSTMMAEGKISADSRIVFIDDGSKDRTWEIISKLHTENPIFQGIKLSRNRGHQNALLCGLMTLKDKADAVISIDADLQDDINTFDEMVAKYDAMRHNDLSLGLIRHDVTRQNPKPRVKPARFLVLAQGSPLK